MAKLEKMTVPHLLKIRGEVDDEMSGRRKLLEQKIAALGGRVVDGRRNKVTPKYQDKNGNSWAGRGLMAKWLKDAIKGGAKLNSFLVK
jgi:DNA-binding protein H-NS